jgi:hypothetical protein
VLTFVNLLDAHQVLSGLDSAILRRIWLLKGKPELENIFFGTEFFLS